MKVTVDFEECLKDSPRFRCVGPGGARRGGRAGGGRVGRSAGPAGPAQVPRPRPAPLPLPVPPRAGGSSQPRACGSGDPSRGQARARAALLSPLGWPLLCHGCALRAADVFCLGLSHLVAMRSRSGLIESWNCMIVCNSVWLLITVRCRIHLSKKLRLRFVSRRVLSRQVTLGSHHIYPQCSYSPLLVLFLQGEKLGEALCLNPVMHSALSDSLRHCCLWRNCRRPYGEIV